MAPFSNCGGAKKVDLYLIADSYIWAKFKQPDFYCGVNKLTNIKTNFREVLSGKLDSTKINVLIVEFAERNVRDILRDSIYVAQVITNDKKDIQKTGESSISSYLFLKNINNNANLELNIWDFSAFRFIKEFKADLNYKLFNEVNSNVGIDNSGNRLFYGPTIDTTNIMSSFKYLPDNENDMLISRLNDIYATAKKKGFTSVYLSIIPNPVSVLAPAYDGLHYNHLVERIQKSQQLKIPVINVLPNFTRNKNSVYCVSDSHWTKNGAAIWLNLVNNRLDSIARSVN
jgi:hypothetical protein